MGTIFGDLLDIAQTWDVSTPENGLVLYSISYLPTKENREKAFEFVSQNEGKITIENTICGAKLEEEMKNGGYDILDKNEIAQIWAVASKRMIAQAKGKVIAFVKDADERSVFCKVELPEILKNENIVAINNIDKFEFARNFKCFTNLV